MNPGRENSAPRSLRNSEISVPFILTFSQREEISLRNRTGPRVLSGILVRSQLILVLVINLYFENVESFLERRYTQY